MASSSSSSSSPSSMQAWTYFTYGGDLSELALRTVKFPSLSSPTDIIVKNMAISLNPTDDKQRSGSYGNTGVEPEGVIGGRDASGVVVVVGSAVTHLKVGDEVFYCPSNVRPGTFAQYTAVDSRLVALKPSKLTHELAAALPLTTLTVWQSLKEKVAGGPVRGQSILVTAGAGGAGSAVIQLSKAWGLHVTATASRGESKEWCKQMGADEVIDHSKPLAPQLSNLPVQTFDFVYDCFPDAMFDQLVELVKPRGQMFFLLPFSTGHVNALKTVFLKSVSLHFEMMFARAMYQFDEQKVGQLLSEVAALVDGGQIKSTANKVFEWTQLNEAFRLLVSSKTIGKSVVTVQH